MNDSLAGVKKSDALIKGNLHTYRFCDNVWTFILEDASVTLTLGDGKETISVDTAKIVAVEAAL